MQALRWWLRCLRAAMGSCHFSFKRGDPLHLAKDLALCLTMLALLPEGLRSNHMGKAEAIPREVERGAKPLAEHGGPQSPCAPLFVKGSSQTNSSPQLKQPAQDTPVSHSGSGQDIMMCGSHELHLHASPVVVCATREPSSPTIQQETPGPTSMSPEGGQGANNAQQVPGRHPRMTCPARSESALRPEDAPKPAAAQSIEGRKVRPFHCVARTRMQLPCGSAGLLGWLDFKSSLRSGPGHI
jgi:hypothetical protein